MKTTEEKQQLNRMTSSVNCILLDVMEILKKTRKNNKNRKKIQYLLNSIICFSDNYRRSLNIEEENKNRMQLFSNEAYEFLKKEKFYN